MQSGSSPGWTFQLDAERWQHRVVGVAVAAACELPSLPPPHLSSQPKFQLIEYSG